MNLPLSYVRDKPKAHGPRNRIEGLPEEKGYEGRKVLLIEDPISTGGRNPSSWFSDSLAVRIIRRF